ncbi:MAG: hypothetical protein JNK10_04185 [Cyclobacteriaceae bacterium]|nr:hypothetical protein [Cyclobacteriaceae bacterium]
MRILYLAILLLCACLSATAQGQGDYRKVLSTLRSFAVSDSIRLQPLVDLWWNERKSKKEVPLIAEDSVAFFYRGPASKVEWMGDFNAWGYKTDFKNKGKRVKNTDIWLLTCSFPKSARLDYKLVINGSSWILDPINPRQQWSGVGGGSPNSELRMPDWKEDPILTQRNNIQHGTITKDLVIDSKSMGYQLTYSVYLPAGTAPTSRLPVLFTTDGNEYLMPELGNMATILDNLIADGKIPPIVVVFVDHREPINRSNNRRMQELNMNEKYLAFYTKELIPLVETNFPVRRDPAHRGILGTSMGGLTSAYFSFSRPDVFGLAGIQSPAFWSRPEVYNLCDSITGPKVRVFMTSGLINDTSEGARRMKEVLQKNACTYQYRETQEGHSWGNWRNLIDDILIDLYGTP